VHAFAACCLGWLPRAIGWGCGCCTDVGCVRLTSPYGGVLPQIVSSRVRGVLCGVVAACERVCTSVAGGGYDRLIALTGRLLPQTESGRDPSRLCHRLVWRRHWCVGGCASRVGCASWGASGVGSGGCARPPTPTSTSAAAASLVCVCWASGGGLRPTDIADRKTPSGHRFGARPPTPTSTSAAAASLVCVCWASGGGLRPTDIADRSAPPGGRIGKETGPSRQRQRLVNNVADVLMVVRANTGVVTPTIRTGRV
jgi:hypothetical protein